MLENKEESRFAFTVVSNSELSFGYSGGCSGGRSACCTRVCTRYAQPATVQQWGNFLAINAGVLQY